MGGMARERAVWRGTAVGVPVVFAVYWAGLLGHELLVVDFFELDHLGRVLAVERG